MNYEGICLMLEYQYFLLVKKRNPEITDSHLLFSIAFPRDWDTWNEFEIKANLLTQAIKEGKYLDVLMRDFQKKSL